MTQCVNIEKVKKNWKLKSEANGIKAENRHCLLCICWRGCSEPSESEQCSADLDLQWSSPDCTETRKPCSPFQTTPATRHTIKVRPLHTFTLFKNTKNTFKTYHAFCELSVRFHYKYINKWTNKCVLQDIRRCSDYSRIKMNWTDCWHHML